MSNQSNTGSDTHPTQLPQSSIIKKKLVAAIPKRKDLDDTEEEAKEKHTESVKYLKQMMFESIVGS